MPMLQLELPVARTLVQRLSTDDAFRERFTTDTAAALLEAGHRPQDPAALARFVAECGADIVLADKATIAGAEEAIVSMLTSGTGYSVPMLERGQGTPRTRR